VVYERLSLFGGAGHEVARATGAHHVLEVNALLAEEEAAYRSLFHVGLAQRIESSILAAADLRIAVSDELALAVRAYAPDRPTLVVPNGADTDLFAARPDRVLARHSLSLPADPPLLVFTGTVRPWHGLDLAISALEVLPDEVRLVIAGDGELKADLVRHARRLGVAHRLHWLGRLPHDRIPALLAAGDLALAPYPQLPGFAFSPLKLYEYLAAGIPVIASDIGQIPALLEHGRYGRLVEPGNVHALAAAIRSELSNPAAGQRRASLARRFSLSMHSWTNRAQSILDAVAELPAPDRHTTEGRHALAR
jgi:glycosyltransferase involved in cell wall biosynthesis